MIIANRLAAKRFFVVFLAALTAITAMFAFGIPERAEAASKFTVYLQAGHSPASLGNGNIQNGIKESTLNEQLTKKTYEAIKAKGINVVLLNPISIDSSLPSLIKDQPGERGQYAYYSPEPAMLTALTWPSRFDSSVTEQGDLVISLHHNAYADSSIRGYEVYYANTVGGDYGRTAQAAERSKKAAQLIEKSLAKASFGIPARAPVVRENNSNNGLTKNSPVPSVLVETAYMSNASDLSAARNATNQNKIAAQLADAVAAYKDSVWEALPATSVAVKAFAVSAKENAFTVSASFKIPSEVSTASVEVWPASAGVESAKIYPLSRNASGTYTANITTSDFGDEPDTYTFALYVTDKNGVSSFLESVNEKAVLKIKGPAADEISVSKASETAVKATLKAVNVKADNGVAGVRFAVWSREGGQDDLKWYPATASGSNWSATINNADHKKRTGTFIAHAYGTDKKGNDALLGAVTFVLGVPQVSSDTEPPKMEGSLTTNLATASDLALKVTNVVDTSGVENVRFAFWSQADQSDLVWYNGARSGNSWNCRIDLDQHPSTYGAYTVHAYATDTVGNDGLLHAETLRLGTDLEHPKAEHVSAKIISSGTNLALLTAEQVTDADSGVASVRFAVWTKQNGQDDLVWYETEQDKQTGNWDVTISGRKHHDEKGPYEVHCYAIDNAGNIGLVGNTVFTFESGDTRAPEAGGMTASADIYMMPRADITIHEVTDDTGVAGVRLAVWNELEGEKSRKWYTAKRSGRDWIVSFDWSEDFGMTGIYELEAYATDYAGNEAQVASMQVEVAQSAIGGYPIMGVSEATTAQLVNYMLRYDWDNDWYGMTVEEFCQIYMDVCEAEGVRAEVAFAQMIHETGGLKYGNLVTRNQYNFAGLGASGIVTPVETQKQTYAYTDDGKCRGIQFETVANGIKSHVQHLKGYASTDPLVLDKAPEYDRYGFMELGCAPTVESLSGKWATSETYALKIMLFVEGILNESKEMPDIEPISAIPSIAVLRQTLDELNAHDE